MHTAQHAITSLGKTVSWVFLCMQEPTDKFGPLAQKKVDAVVREENVTITCSKSGSLKNCTIIFTGRLNIFSNVSRTVFTHCKKDEKLHHTKML
jgi:hypothetical protein